MSDLDDLGSALRDARRAEGLTQVQLADLAGVSDRTLREIEKGSGSPSIGAVMAVATTLGVTLKAER